MAKNKDSITAAELRTGGVFIDSSAFNNEKGELFAGLNILKLKAGEAAGPFVLKNIMLQQKLGKDKKMKPVDVYVADHQGLELRMPAAASFIGKAKDSNLSVGDTFLVRRDENDYVSAFGKRDCASYQIKITARGTAKKK
jgi:hypothetical protein